MTPVDDATPRPLPGTPGLAGTGGTGRLAAWLLARVAAGAVDAELAAGADPDADARRALRARHLVQPAYRRKLARAWQQTLARAVGEPPVVEARVPLPRPRIRAAHAEITTLITALRARGPVPARGVALALAPLVDPDGAMYGEATATGLRTYLREAVAQLDPARSLYDVS